MVLRRGEGKQPGLSSPFNYVSTTIAAFPNVEVRGWLFEQVLSNPDNNPMRRLSVKASIRFYLKIVASGIVGHKFEALEGSFQVGWIRFEPHGCFSKLLGPIPRGRSFLLISLSTYPERVQILF